MLGNKSSVSMGSEDALDEKQPSAMVQYVMFAIICSKVMNTNLHPSCPRNPPMFKTPNARKDVKMVAMLEDIQKNDSRIGSSVFVYQSVHQR